MKTLLIFLSLVIPCSLFSVNAVAAPGDIVTCSSEHFELEDVYFGEAIQKHYFAFPTFFKAWVRSMKACGVAAKEAGKKGIYCHVTGCFITEASVMEELKKE